MAIRKLVTLLLSAGLIAIGSLALHQARTARDPKASLAELKFFPDSSLVKVAALDRPTFLASLSWIDALNYFGENMFKTKRLIYLPAYTENILTLDPLFLAAVIWFGSINPLRPDGTHGENTRVGSHTAYLGILKQFEINREVDRPWFLLGYNYAFELGDREKALPLLEYAAALDPVLDTSDRLVATYFAQDNKPEAAVRILERSINDLVAFNATIGISTPEEWISYYALLLKQIVTSSPGRELRSERIRGESLAIRRELERRFRELNIKEIPQVVKDTVKADPRRISDLVHRVLHYRDTSAHLPYDLYALIHKDRLRLKEADRLSSDAIPLPTR